MLVISTTLFENCACQNNHGCYRINEKSCCRVFLLMMMSRWHCQSVHGGRAAAARRIVL